MQAQQEDMQAFATLLQRYERSLYGYLCRLTAQPEDAEDLFQETFLRVFRHLGQYRPEQPFRPWLYAIATNQCRDYFRRQKRRPVQATMLNNPESAASDSLEQFPTSTAGPDALAIAHETAARLEQAITALPLKQRTVFLMARYQDMPYREIAQALNIPEGTVKSRMNKAVHALLAQLEKDAIS